MHTMRKAMDRKSFSRSMICSYDTANRVRSERKLGVGKELCNFSHIPPNYVVELRRPS
jgi:hypothetical protein